MDSRVVNYYSAFCVVFAYVVETKLFLYFEIIKSRLRAAAIDKFEVSSKLSCADFLHKVHFLLFQ